MKKYLALLLLLLIIPQAMARVLVFTTRTFDVVKPSTTINLIGTAVNYHRISWSYTGTVTTCQVKLESSANGSAWADLIANQACTTAGMATAVTGSHNYVRINMTTLTGGGTVSVTYEGFSTDPSAAVGAGGLPAGGNLDMANFLVTNIGNAGTDFTASGGLNTAGNVNVASLGGVVFLGQLELQAGGIVSWTTRSRLYSPSDGVFRLSNSAGTDFTRLNFGGTTTAFNAISASAAVGAQAQGLILQRADGTPQVFANLGAATNGSMIYCSDCTIANPCAGAGTGAIAKRINSTWICN